MFTHIILPRFNYIPNRKARDAYSITPSGELQLQLPVTFQPSILPAAFDSFMPTVGGREAILNFRLSDEKRIERYDVDGEIREHDVHLYRGTMFCTTDKDDNRSGEVSVICKIAYRSEGVDGLENEALIYTGQLKHLQGKYIPYFYGMFSNERGTLACTILQDGGKPVEHFYISEPSLEIRRHILDAVIEIHRANVVHNRLLRQYRHVLLSPIPESGELQPLIIDFKYAKSDHQCPVKFHRGRGQFRVGDWQPQSDHVSCYELYHFTECLQVWISDTTLFRGTYVLSIEYETPERLLKHVKEHNKIHARPEDQLRIVESEVQMFRDLYREFLSGHSKWPTQICGSGICDEEFESDFETDDDEESEEKGMAKEAGGV